MKYSVDRIEGDIVILDNVETNEIVHVNICEFDFEVREGNIVSFVDGRYILDLNEEIRRKNSLRERMERLRRNSVIK